jgi:integral membrane protein
VTIFAARSTVPLRRAILPPVNLVRESTTDLIVSAFRLVANLEALSWAGLLIGMLFKYLLAPHGELGHTLVSVFGMAHGVLVMVYVALGATVALRLGWRVPTAALALAATIPPFATLAFDRFASSRGQYEVQVHRKP